MFDKFKAVAVGALMMALAGCGNPYAPGSPGFAGDPVVQNDVPSTDRPAVEAGGDVVEDVTGDVVDAGGDAPTTDADDAGLVDRPLPRDAGDGGGEDVSDASDDAADTAADVSPIDRPTPDVPLTDLGMDVIVDRPEPADVIDVPVDAGGDVMMPPTDSGPTCSSGSVLCGTSCRNLTEDTNNCGACGRVCPTGQSCSASACVCPTGQMMCSGMCRNSQTDNDNCGACGNRCSAGMVCSVGVCASTCGTRTNCAGDCVDLTSDVMNCGACGTVCSDYPNTSPVCSSRRCGSSCDPGYVDCDGDNTTGCEVDISSDVRNCGRCGLVCSFANASARCQEAGCVIGSCNTGFGNCDGLSNNGCEATLNTLTNCGACGRMCTAPTGGTVACTAGVCVPACPSGQTLCGSACVSTATDANNCGACGRACTGVTSVCNAGSCVECVTNTDCPSGWTCDIGGRCAEGTDYTITDPRVQHVRMRVVVPSGSSFAVVTPTGGTGVSGTWRDDPCIGGIRSEGALRFCRIDFRAIMPPGVLPNNSHRVEVLKLNGSFAELCSDLGCGASCVSGSTNTCVGRRCVSPSATLPSMGNVDDIPEEYPSTGPRHVGERLIPPPSTGPLCGR